MRALTLACAIALLIKLAAGSSMVAAGENFYGIPPPGKRVDVGGYELHINCQGSGSPTVILEAGIGDWSTHWTAVQRLLQRDTRVCSYDRAGYGWSDPVKQPRDSQRLAAELHALLIRAGIEPPYLLVGHSFGGFNMLLFARIHASEVYGLVLVDASHPESLPYIPAEAGAESDLDTADHGMAMYRETPDESKFPPEALPAIHDRLLSTKAWVASHNEYRYLARSVQELRQAPPLGDIPLTVLSRGLRQWPPGPEGDARERTWREQQEALARLSPRGIHRIASKSGHYIHLDEPGVVAAAVRDMLAAQGEKPAE